MHMPWRGDLMSLRIDKKTLNAVKNLFTKMENKVTLYHFVSSRSESPHQEVTHEILVKISSLTDKIQVIKVNETSPLVKKYNIDKFQAILIHGIKEYNMRYFGAPLGYEFGVLIKSIVDASTGKPELPSNIIESLSSISKRVHILVFVTPTCPYCPLMARAAHMYAVINLNIVADVIEAMEFPELADKYEVYAVPKVIVNDSVEFEGAVPHEVFINKIFEAVR